MLFQFTDEGGELQRIEVAYLRILSLLFLVDIGLLSQLALMPIRFAIFCFLVFNSFSCDESLPSRAEPDKYVQAKYDVSTGVVEIRDSQAVGLGGAFVISVKNINVEVLQDSEYARAEIELVLRDAPGQTAQVVSTKRELTDPSLVSHSLITLRPNVTAVFLKQWEHKALSGRWCWEFVHLTPKTTPLGEPYLESDPVNFVASGKVQLFKTRSFDTLPPIQFSLVYRIF